MNSFNNHFMQIFGLLAGIITFLFILNILIVGRYFDRFLKQQHPELSFLQRSIQYAFCLYDMHDTQYQTRKGIYVEVNFIEYSRTIDIIIASLFITFLYLFVGLSIIYFTTYFIVLITKIILLNYKGGRILWSHISNIFS